MAWFSCSDRMTSYVGGWIGWTPGMECSDGRDVWNIGPILALQMISAGLLGGRRVTYQESVLA